MKFNQNTFLIIQISILVKPQKSDWPMKGGREGPKHWAFGGTGSLSPGLKLGTGARRGADQPERGSTARPQPRVAIERLQCRSCLTKQQFQFYLLLINLHLNSCLWLVTTTLDRTGLRRRAGNEKNTEKKDTERDKYKLPTSKLFLSTTVSMTDGCLGP